MAGNTNDNNTCLLRPIRSSSLVAGPYLWVGSQDRPSCMTEAMTVPLSQNWGEGKQALLMSGRVCLQVQRYLVRIWEKKGRWPPKPKNLNMSCRCDLRFSSSPNHRRSAGGPLPSAREQKKNGYHKACPVLGPVKSILLWQDGRSSGSPWY